MRSELGLLKTESFGNILSLISIVTFIISALMSARVERSRLRGVDLRINPSPAQVAEGGAWILLIGSFIFFIGAVERIKQEKEKLGTVTINGTLTPELWIGAGALFGLISALAFVIGSRLDVLEGSEEIII